MKRAETSALFYFFITKWNFLGIMYNEGIIREDVCIVTKQKNRLKQFILILLSFLMIFSNMLVANAAVNYDNDVAPLYINISSHFEKFEISGIKAICSATLKAKNSVPLKIKMELQKEKSKGYETV